MRPLWEVSNHMGCYVMIYDPEALDALATLPAWVLETLQMMATNCPHWEHDAEKRCRKIAQTATLALQRKREAEE